jgi:conjugal transfer pilus assembly protein TrbC
VSAINLPRHGFVLAALLVVTVSARAELSHPVISDADLERVRREQPVLTEQDFAAARRKHVMPDERVLPPAASHPVLEALPQPATNTPIDLEALARGYAAQSEAMQAAQGFTNGPRLFIFVSLSMPQPALQRLVEQAARARASVLIRGFVKGSLRETVARLQPLIGKRQVAVQIDPQAFDRFAITRVPSFVLMREGVPATACASGTCAPPEAFLHVAGDVSLDYALEAMQRMAPGFQTDTAGFLQRLKGQEQP